MAQYQPLAVQEEIELEPTAPTEHDFKLRRVADDIPWNAYLIATIELAERFSYYGTTVVFVNFIQQPLPMGSRTGAPVDPNGQAGALGMGQRASTAVTTLNTFWVYLTPILGAYVADAHWGRYKTISVAVGIALAGHLLLVYAALPSTLERPDYAFAIFICAIIIMGTGTGAFKSNISPLVAEQYTRTTPFTLTLPTGERVLVDPDLTIRKIYVYFYLFINIGSVTGQIGMTYAEKYAGFWMAFALPTLAFLLCPFILWIGRNRYVTSPPAGSSAILTSVRAFAYAARGRWSANPATVYKNFTASDFWARVKPSGIRGRRPTWMTFDDAWVDELQRGIGACFVLSFFPFYWLSYGQMNNNLTSQAATMNTHGLPNDVLSNIDPLALLVLIPFCDKVLYPFLGPRLTTPLKRITLGFIVAAMSMAWAAVVQFAVYTMSPCGSHAGTCTNADGTRIIAPLSVWWQSGAYILVAASEILASVTGLEYAYSNAPPGMRSLVTALFQSTTALASVFYAAFVWLASDPFLVWNYAIMSVIAACTAAVFWSVFQKKDSQDEQIIIASSATAE